MGAELPEVHPTAASLAAFFTCFYGALLGGSSVRGALRKAEEHQPQLDGAFGVHEQQQGPG